MSNIISKANLDIAIRSAIGQKQEQTDLSTTVRTPSFIFFATHNLPFLILHRRTCSKHRANAENPAQGGVLEVRLVILKSASG